MTPKWMSFGDGEAKRERRASMIVSSNQLKPPESTTTTLPPDGSSRKRLSIFGHRPPAANSAAAVPSLSTMSSQAQLRPLRPTRAATVPAVDEHRHPEQAERRRLSIFARGKKTKRPSQPTNEYPLLPRSGSSIGLFTANAGRDWGNRFDSEEDYYRYLKKLSISPPFNFQHITHTKRQQLPCLENSTQRELVAEFWAVSAHQSPKRQLKGIGAEDLAAKHKSMGIAKGWPHSKPASPVQASPPPCHPHIGSPLATLPQLESREPASLTDAHEQELSLEDTLMADVSAQHPKRSSSIGAVNCPRSGQAPLIVSDASNILDSGQVPGDTPHDASDSSQTIEYGAALDAVPEEIESPCTRDSYTSTDWQPLKASKRVSVRPSESSLKSVGSSSGSSDSSMAASRNVSSITANGTSFYTQSTGTSSMMATHQRNILVATPTWEDDVDFCYEFEAEATCDFDWDTIPRSGEPLIDSDGGAPLHPDVFVPISTSAESSSLRQPLSISSMPVIDTIPTPGHGTRPFVGYHGFMVARGRSNDPSSEQNAVPAPLEKPILPYYSGPLLQAFSATSSQEDLPKPSLAKGGMHFTDFESNRVGSLSDPESVRNSDSRHRKSSSYGSYESVVRPVPITHGEPAGRGSVASIHSLPELLHSKRYPKEGTSLQSRRISRSLESTNPNVIVDVKTPRPNHPRCESRVLESEYDDTIMRRPETPGDRAVLQAAGRAVQRGRSAMPNRSSRLLHSSEDLMQPPHIAQDGGWI